AERRRECPNRRGAEPARVLSRVRAAPPRGRRARTGLRSGRARARGRCARVMTAEERFLFDVQGYVIVEDALPPDRLAAVRDAVVRLTGEAPVEVATVAMPIERDEELLRLAAYEPILERIRELVGPHPKLIDNDAVATPRTGFALGW